jgi:hypothetical protein
MTDKNTTNKETRSHIGDFATAQKISRAQH